MRERLGEFYDQTGKCTHLFTAQFQCYGKTDEGSNVLLLLEIQLEDKWVADHNWIHRSKQMKLLELERGDIVEFEAVVGKYPRQGESFSRAEDCKWDYSLEHVKEMRIVRKRGEASDRL